MVYKNVKKKKNGMSRKEEIKDERMRWYDGGNILSGTLKLNIGWMNIWVFFIKPIQNYTIFFLTRCKSLKPQHI